MSFIEIGALLRRHLPAVLLVLVLAAAIGVSFKRSSPVYSESVGVVFTAPQSAGRPDSFGQPLITIETMMAQTLMSPAAQGWVRAAGGTGRFELVPFNFYDMEYPFYGVPLATLTATSPSPAATRSTFVVVLRVLRQRLGAIQAQAGVRPADRIRTYLAGDTGPIAKRGSAKRVFAGLALLTVVAVFMVATFLDRRRLGAADRRPASIPVGQG